MPVSPQSRYTPRDTIIVNTTAVTGNGNDIISFRDAIVRANAAGGATTIVFGGSVNWNTAVIGPNFPTVTANNVTITGGFNNGAPRIQIGGIASADGIVIAGNGCLIEGLYISSFGRGMLVTGSNNTIRSCTFGANNRDGIEINGANNTIGPNVIANSNTRFGMIIAGTGATGNTIVNSQAAFNSTPNACGFGITGGASNNTIGPGTIFAANAAEGIVIQGGAHDNTFSSVAVGQTFAANSAVYPNGHNGIGMTDFLAAPYRNHFVNCPIGGNGWSGVFISGDGCNENQIDHCQIGTSPDGMLPRPNGLGGIALADGASENVIGPANTISGNAGSGVIIYGNSAATESNVVIGNVIGLSADESVAIPNTMDGLAIFSVGPAHEPAQNTVIGGPGNNRNVIAGNGRDGVALSGEGAIQNDISDCSIGTDSSHVRSFPNQRRGISLTDASELRVRQGNNYVLGRGDTSISVGAALWVGASGQLLFLGGGPTVLTLGGVGPSGQPSPGESALIEVRSGNSQSGLAAGSVRIEGGKLLNAQVVVLDGNASVPGFSPAVVEGWGYVQSSMINRGIVRVSGTYSRDPFGIFSTPGSAGSSAQLWIANDYEQSDAGRIELEVTDVTNTNSGGVPKIPLYMRGIGRFGGAVHLTHDGSTLTNISVGNRYHLAEFSRIQSRFSRVTGLRVQDDSMFIGLNYLEFEEGGDAGEALGIEVGTWPTPQLASSGGRLTQNGAPVADAVRPYLTVVTHGTNSNALPGQDFWQIAEEMGRHATPGLWTVVAQDWSVDAYDQPVDTAEIAMDIGESLVHWLREVGLGNYQAVHALGHSSGSWLADGIVDQWERSSPSAWSHLTVWDAYNTRLRDQPGRPNPVLGESADFADHIVHMGGGGFLAFGTNDTLANCVNVNVSLLLDTVNPVASHSYPWQWYRDTARLPYNYAIPGSRLGFRNSAEIRGFANRPRFERDVQRDAHLLVYPNGEIFRLAYSWSGVLHPATLPIDFSPTGQVVVTPDELMLYSGSPVWADIHIHPLQAINWVQIEVEFVGGGAGTFSAAIDGEALLEGDESAFRTSAGPASTGKMRTRHDLPSGEHLLRVYLNPTGVAQAVVRLSGLTMGRDDTLPICIADVDDGSGTGTVDGGVTLDDLLYYLDLYGLGVDGADVDDGQRLGIQDGGITIDDLLYFLIHFEAGC